MRPPLRWAGSKRSLVPLLLESTPERWGRYFEAFAGSACLFFALKPANGKLSDINADLVEFYRELALNPRLIWTLAASMPRTADFYYAVRRIEIPAALPTWRAARFLYLNRHCFNGVYRVNRKGVFNVPRGRSGGEIPSLECCQSASRLLRSAQLEVGDFETSLQEAGEGDFVYLDPPYFAGDRKTYGEYGYDGCFRGSDLSRFIDLVTSLSDRGVNVLLSYQEDQALRDSLKGWIFTGVQVRRHVAGFAAFRRTAAEMLVANYPLRGTG